MSVFAGRCSSEIRFEILDKGDVSGFAEEAYFVIKNETSWVHIWERHTLIYALREPPPSIDFSKNIVVCAFMGQRSTTGYSIDIRRIWTDGRHVFVEVIKHGPPEGLAVCQMVMSPYIIVLMERMDAHFVFQVADDDGETAEFVLSEFSSASIIIIFFALICWAVFSLKVKNVVKWKNHIMFNRKFSGEAINR